MSERLHTPSPLLNQLKWLFFRVSDELSLTSKLALLLLLLTLLDVLMVYLPRQQALTRLTQISASQHNTPPASANPAQPLQRYVAQFPAQATRASQLSRLVDLAKQEQLLLDEVTYKTQQLAGQAFSQTSVEFSVIDTYPNVHRFLNRVLADMPFVTIDTLRLTRENVLDNAVEARIRLTFYFAQP